MEKLQPVIKQLFWICFGLLVLLAPLGWWKAQGDLSAKIDERSQAVDTAFKDAGKNVVNIPNARWTESAAKMNETHMDSYDRAAARLREDQLEARVYPKSIRHELNQLRFNSRIGDPALRERFGDLYRSYFWEQLQVIKPFIRGEGLVDISQAQITQEDETRWARNPPTSQEIWNAQEDIWLLRSIYDSIAMVNKGAERIDKAPLRSLLLLQLRGGDPDAEPGGGGGAGGFNSGGGDYESGDASSFGSGGFAGASGMSMAGRSQGAWQKFMGSVSNDLLNEEFGAVAGAAGFGNSGMSSFSSNSMSSSESGGDYEGGDSEDGDSSAGSTGKRYVHDDEAMPFRTRAFVLKVKILQQNIPNLLAELTNSKFPVEIVRVDAVFGNDPKLSSASGNSGYSGGQFGSSQYSSGGSSGYEDNSSSSYESSESGMGSGVSSGMSMMMSGGGNTKSAGGLGSPFGPNGVPPGSLGRKPTRAELKKIADGKGVFASAMLNPDLSIVRVAGLMTMYRSQSENEAEAESEAAAETESQATSTNSGTSTESADGTPADPGTTEPDDSGTDSKDDSATATDEGNTDPGVDGDTPDDGTSDDKGGDGEAGTDKPADSAAGSTPDSGTDPEKTGDDTDSAGTPPSDSSGGSEPDPSDSPDAATGDNN